MIYLLFLNFAAPLHQHRLCKSYPIVLHCKKLWLDRRYSQSLTRIFHNVIHCCQKGLKFCVLKQNLKMQIPHFLRFVWKMTLCWTFQDFECRHTKNTHYSGVHQFLSQWDRFCPILHSHQVRYIVQHYPTVIHYETSLLVRLQMVSSCYAVKRRLIENAFPAISSTLSIVVIESCNYEYKHKITP